jgi:hypothetical protein
MVRAGVAHALAVIARLGTLLEHGVVMAALFAFVLVAARLAGRHEQAGHQDHGRELKDSSLQHDAPPWERVLGLAALSERDTQPFLFSSSLETAESPFRK